MINRQLLLTGLFLVSSAAVSMAAVPSGWSVEPAAGSTVEEIKVISVTNSRGYLDPYLNRSIKINGTPYTFTTKKSGNMDQTLTFTLNESVTAAGEYEVVIPAGTFTYTFNEDDNPEISFNLSIEGTAPDPGEFTPIENAGFSINPDQGVVNYIKDFTIEYAHSAILPEPNSLIKVTLQNEATGETVATFKSGEGAGMQDVVISLDEPFTTPGTYIVNLPEGAFYDYTDEDWPAARFRYVVSGGSVEIPQENVTAIPESGSTVETLDRISLFFPDMSEIYASGPNKDGIVVKKNGVPVEVEGTFDYDSSTMDRDEIQIVLTPAVTESGEYEIYVPARALSLGISTFDSRWNEEFTLSYTVKGALADGTKIKVEPLTYKVVSGVDRTLSVTWPDSESEYSGVTEIPSSVEYEGKDYTVVEIGRLAFSEVKGIDNLKVPETVTSIGEGAFWDCSIKTIELPQTLTAIESDAFSDSGLTTFTMPESVTTLGTDVFSGCVSLESLSLPASLTEIPDGTAQGCQILKSIDIPAGVARIGGFAFSECSQLAAVDLPENLVELGRFAFAYCVDLKKLPVPQSVTTVGHGVFYQSGLEEAALPESVTVIPDGMYQCCASLRQFRIEDTVTEIEKEAFYWCFALEDITFGRSVATIGADAFKGDDALVKVTSLNTTPPAGAAFSDAAYANATLFVPQGSEEAYRAADGWKQFHTIASVQTGVEEISGSSFSVKAAEGALVVESENEIRVADAAGRIVYSGAAGRVELPEGLYIVVSGARKVKVVL